MKQQPQPEAQGPIQITFRYTAAAARSMGAVKALTRENTANKAINAIIEDYPGMVEKIAMLEKEIKTLLEEVSRFHKIHLDYKNAQGRLSDWQTSTHYDDIQEKYHRLASRW